MGSIAGIKNRSPNTYDEPPRPSGGTPPAPVEFIYKPGGTAGGQIFTDPWQLWLAGFLAGVPVTVYVDCSIQSPAPWPVDSFQVNFTFAQSPIVSTPAVLGLVAGTNPFNSAPSNGSILFPESLDGVGVVNVSSSPPYAMVQCGDIFGQRFTMKNGAYITLGGPATVSLGILTNGTFELEIDNCLDPFPNGGANFPNNPGTLDLLVSRAAPSLLLPSFVGVPGAILNFRYDASVPQSQLVEGAWGGTVNLIPIDDAQSVSYAANAPDWVFPPPTTVAQAITRIAANAGNVHPIP
jgi:hypothetical protein